eukprot:CAMPEP_0176428606 /NCGR_PEP_ID=MMETSP0127-20121128/13244_1 /TAXON_ID=938130 /ORGANISM="Platyophrya macrostoma, Strain WH" /LENGTH=396 /DNA_ID=CAMNT_0017810309 /DNA_START=2039 /DNA_END=3229 /DNA_ORIENTATION=-
MAIDFPEIDFKMFYFAIHSSEVDKLPPELAGTTQEPRPEFFEHIRDCVLIDGVAVTKQIFKQLKSNIKKFEGGFHIEKIITRLIVFFRILYPLSLQIYSEYTDESSWDEFTSAENLIILSAFISYLIPLIYFYFVYDVFWLGLGLQLKKIESLQLVSKLISEGTVAGLSIPTYVPQNVTNWVNLRRLLTSSNTQIHTIVDVNLSVILGFLVIIISIIVGHSLGHITPPSFLEDITFQITAATYLLIMIGIVISSMIIGAYVNDYFRIHQNLLQQKEDILRNLHDFAPGYLHNLEELEDEASSKQNNKYAQEIAELRKILKVENIEENYLKFSKKLVKVFKHSIERLHWEEIDRPNKILSIKTTIGSLLTLGSLLSILGFENIKLIIEYFGGEPIEA